MRKIVQKLEHYRTLSFSILFHEDRYFKLAHDVAFDSREVHSYRNNFEALLSDITKWKAKNYRIIFVSASVTRAKRLADNLMNHDVACFFSEDEERVLSEKRGHGNDRTTARRF